MDYMSKFSKIISLLAICLIFTIISCANQPSTTMSVDPAFNSQFVSIPTGEFMMGSNNGPRNSLEKPAHRVRISRSFEMGKYEVTQAQWKAIMGNNPSYFKGSDLPVE